MPGIFVITGPSGVGKTSIAYALLGRRPNLKKVVTCTTRRPRDGERDGVDYHFLDADAFKRLIGENGLFEHAFHYGNHYGSRRADVDALLAGGNDVLFVVDVVGAAAIKRDHPEAVTVFVGAESADELVARMESRDKGAGAGRGERLAAIERELAYAAACDHVVTNRTGSLDLAVADVAAIMDGNRRTQAS
jgi:guanylate kinase